MVDMNKISLSVLMASVLLVGTAHAAPWAFDGSHTRVGFTVDHLGYSTVTGAFNTFDGQVEYDAKQARATQVNFKIDTSSINTGWAARDEHLKKPEFFNVDAYPSMTFVSTGVKMRGANKAKVTGTLTLLGVSKPITLDVVLRKHAVSPITQKDTIGFEATTTIKRSDFGMKAYVPAVGDLIPVRIDGELNPVEAPAK